MLDLSFFRALQTLQVKTPSSNVDDLIAATTAAWVAISFMPFLNNFCTFELVLIEIMRCGGGNNFVIPHVGKSKLIKSGRLPDKLRCDAEVADKARWSLSPDNQLYHMAQLEKELAKERELVDLCNAIEEIGLDMDPSVLNGNGVDASDDNFDDQYDEYFMI